MATPEARDTALVADPIYRTHDPGPGHPESPKRFDTVVQALHGSGLISLSARAATYDELALCHTSAYLAQVRADFARGARSLSTGDTDIGPASYEAALRAAGGVMNAVDAVIAGRVRNAFCAVRPPGHHATPTRGMGFCIFNNVAIAARYAQRKYGLNRVLIADWDVHHGNGTQEIFYRDGSVLVFNTHQWPLYPGTGRADETGEGAGKGLIINCPFPAGSGRREILGAFLNKLVPAAKAFRPDLVLVSAGFDSREGDALGRFVLTDRDFADLTTVVLDIAAEFAHGRLVSVLEGGYTLSGLASASASHVAALQRGH